MRYIIVPAKILLSVAQAILDAVYALLRMLCRILGVPAPATPQIPLPETTPATVRRTLEDSYEKALERDLEPVADIGMAVHQYASAREPWIRGSVDLTGLSPSQFAWLMSLSDADLQRLAAAGPAACQRAVTGKRSGIVGLPVPSALPEPEPVAVDPRERVRDALRERIQIDRGRRMVAAA